MRLLRPLFFIACFLALSFSSFGQKIDTLTTLDGKDVVGEIKDLTSGKLLFSTVYMGDANITWSNLIRLVSKKNLTIQVTSGKIYHGSLVDPDEEKQLKIKDEYSGELTSIPMKSVILIEPVVRKRIHRIKGYLDLGFSYTKGSDVTQATFGALVNYRTDQWDLEYNLSTITHVQGKIDQTTYKRDTKISASKLLPKRFSAEAYVSAEQNSELGIELRGIGGLALGNDFLLRPRNRMNLSTGPLFNQEQFADTTDASSSPNQSSTEWMVSYKWRAFSYSLPELQLNLDLNYYYNITLGNRNRLNFNMNLSYEIIDDFFLSFSFYTQYDSNPPDPTAANVDWGNTTGLRYEFKSGQRAKRKF